MADKSDALVLRRTFSCSKRVLFDAWSKPTIMAKWLYARREDFCESTVTNSFTIGGRYSITMHLPNSDVELFGEYTAINRYNQIAFTWSSPAISNSLVDLAFREKSAHRSELVLTHTLFPSAEVRGQHNEGWLACFENLEMHHLAKM